jgi:hypothetical protein
MSDFEEISPTSDFEEMDTPPQTPKATVSTVEPTGLASLPTEPLEAAKRFATGVKDIAVSPFKAAGEAWDATLGGPKKGGWGKVVGDVGQGFLATGRGLAHEAPALAGMITGGALGAPLGPAGIAGGAALGGMAAKTLQNLIRKYGEGENLTPRESNIDVYGAGINAVAPELGAALLRPILQPTRMLGKGSQITPAGEKLSRVLEEQGIVPYPGDIRQANLIDKITGMSSKSFGGGAIRNQAQRELNAIIGPEGYVAKESARINPKVGTSEDVGALVQNELTGQATGEVLKRAGTKADLEQQFGIAGESLANIGERASKAVAVGRSQGQAMSSEVWDTMLGELKGKAVVASDFATALGDIGLDPAVVLKKYRDPITGEYRIPGEEMPGVRSRFLVLSRTDPKYKGPSNALLKDIENVPGIKESYDAARAFHREVVGEEGRAFKGLSPQDMWHHFEPMDAIRLSTKGKDQAIGMLRIMEKNTGRQGPLWEATEGAFVSRAINEPRFLASLGPETRAMFFPEETQNLIGAIHGGASQAEKLATRYGGRDAGRISSTLAAGGPGSAQELGTLLSQLAGTPAESALKADLLQRITQNVPRIRALKPAELENWRAYVGKNFGEDAASLFDKLHDWSVASKAGNRAMRSEMAPTGVNTPSVGQTMEFARGARALAAGNPGQASISAAYGALPFAWSRFISGPKVSRWLGKGYDVPSPYTSIFGRP